MSEPPPPPEPPPAAAPIVPPPDAVAVPPAGLPPARWGPGQVGIGLLALVGASIIQGLVVFSFDSDLASTGSILALQTLSALTFVGVAFVAGSGAGRALAAPAWLGLRRPLRSPWGPAAAAYGAYFACAIAIALTLEPEQQDVTRELGFGEGRLAADVLVGFLIVVAAPIGEEVFFRGFMYGGLRRRMPLVAATVLSGALWGLFHLPTGSWAVVLQLSVFGIVLGWLYERTGSIWPGVAVHAINNALAFALLASS